MIPPLNEHGYLPPGIHPASMDECIARFGVGSEQREAQAHSLLWLVPMCRRAGITKILINGSFVTSRRDPNDVDVVLLQSPAYEPDSTAAADLTAGLPFLEIKIVAEEEYRFFAEKMFASDRDMIPKGILEIEP